MILLIFASFSVITYLFLTWNFTYWRIRGVKGPNPLPIFGSFPGLIVKNQHFADNISDIYRKYKESDSYVGVFLLRTPQLMLLEPKLVHDVFVTSFNHFNSNDVAKLIDKKKDPLIANNPFILSGKEWREKRALLSPGLTIGRTRYAYPIMQSVSKSWSLYLKSQIDIQHVDGLNGKDIALRFTSENIANCVLGITANTFSDQFLPIAKYVKLFSENSTVFIIYTFIAGLFPNIVNFMTVKFIPKKCEDFFENLIREAYTIRVRSKIRRNDFMDHLVTLVKSKLLNEHEIASHAMTFLIDGLDTSATVISHCLFLLGRHQTAQKKLLCEITKNSINGELSFDKLNELSYLDACINETIRILPPGLWSIKTCTAPHTFTGKNGERVSLAIGDSVLIPIYALHHDSNYYTNPEQFQPERFLNEKGSKLKTFHDIGVFLGFGHGPRTCLGSYFATVQIKVAIASIVRSFKISLNAKTKPYVKLDPKMFLAHQDGGVWLDFQLRS
ncbi:PREDICTED: probable cytochrome P450 28d1 [Rhagoletis zephyria]|uniref:probable cytochrome P450 28d1 n=1 Tax=Rhagoletis zephyria TaxID=28612 RepID=UPI0008114614|nr:PREDICTED: probable cytochrome P450 28d1 [Rhagoletis zephyria]